MNHRILFYLGLGISIVQPAAIADTTLEYLVTEGSANPAKTQPVIIKEGKILVKAVGGDGNLDILYSASPEIIFMVDHGKHSVMTLDEAQVNQFAKKTEVVQPLLQGLGEQLTKLDPKQRSKWESMLGGKIPLDTIAEAAKPVQATKIVKSGQIRKVAGIGCQPMTIFQGKTKTAEVCMAEPAKLNLSDADYATLRSLLSFLERVVGKTQFLAKQFGINLPELNLKEVSGVPLEFNDLAGKGQNSFRFKQSVATTISADVMKIPDGYQFGPFKLWK